MDPARPVKVEPSQFTSTQKNRDLRSISAGVVDQASMIPLCSGRSENVEYSLD